jgi:hypothetical protein
MGSSVGRKGRHLVVFRMAEGQAIDVIRLLHEMNLPRPARPQMGQAVVFGVVAECHGRMRVGSM